MSEVLQPHPTADLESQAAKAVAAGDVRGAARLLEAAASADAAGPDLWLSLAACRRRLGEVEAAMAAVDRALAIAPRAYHALLMRGSLLEKTGRAREAAIAYGVALTQAPPALEALSPAARQATEHAREVNARHLAEMEAAIAEGAAGALARCTAEEVRRVGGFVDDVVGRGRRYRQEPSAFCYPGLPAIAFYDRARFDWLEALEAETDAIAGELAAILAGDGAGFTPYVNYDDHLPLDQWRALNRSVDWSAFHILFNGAPVPGNAERCPRTLAALARTPQPRIEGRSPAAMFSVLRPHTTIPPHTGVSNTRLVCHLPLIVPPGCRFRVGNETRVWERGRAWVFDDTIEHEAVNASDAVRIILIFDIEQPAISPAEHRAIAEVTRAIDRFGGAPAPSGI